VWLLHDQACWHVCRMLPTLVPPPLGAQGGCRFAGCPHLLKSSWVWRCNLLAEELSGLCSGQFIPLRCSARYCIGFQLTVTSTAASGLARIDLATTEENSW
jgi:hypothetical protein